jgi:tetratricopeptide (TPR) repeat protein
MLSKPHRAEVRSSIQFARERPKLEWEQLRTENRIPAIDLSFRVKVRNKLRLDVPGLESYETTFADNSALQEAVYRHRLFLLPGRYNVFLEVDGFRTGYVLDVKKLDESQALATAWEPVAGRNEINYLANQFPGSDWTSIGRQYLAADDLARAQACFRKAFALAPTAAAEQGLAQVHSLRSAR